MSFRNSFGTKGWRLRSRSYRPVVVVLEERNLLSFVPVYSDNVGPEPMSVAVGDFNGDGIPDIVAPNTNLNNHDQVNVLLSNGDGSFRKFQAYTVDSPPLSVAVADVNGDGIPDIITADSISTVEVLLGNGNGTFRPPQSYFAGYYPYSVAVGDFNGDGLPDLAVVNSAYPNDRVSVLLGNGDGSFRAPVSYPVGAGTGANNYTVAVGDFTGNGVDDIAVVNAQANTVSVLLSNGDGTFQAKRDYRTGTQPFSVAVGDFNGDGLPDLAVANLRDGTVSVLLNNGDGTFQAATDYASGSQPTGLVVADFNGDGFPDLVTANGYTVAALLGNGDGTFRPGGSSTTGGHSLWALATGDFNRDSFPDVVGVVLDNLGDVTTLLNRADWTAPTVPAPPRQPGLNQTAQSEPLRDPIFASLAAPDLEAPRHFLLTATDLQPKTTRQPSTASDGGQRVQLEADSARTAIVMVRNAHDIVFGLGDRIWDGLASNWVV